MENQEEKKINTDALYYLIGAVFGILTGGFCFKSFGGIIGGLVIGLILTALFVGFLVKGRSEEEAA